MATRSATAARARTWRTVLSTHSINDLLKDFEPVSLLVSTPQLIVAKKTMPANNLQELIAWLKANPDRAVQGTSGIGGYSHLAGLFFQKQTGTRFGFLSNRGPALNDLLAGHVD